MRRAAAVAALCLGLAWLGMRDARVPLLSLVDLGFHELGHLICYVFDAFLPWPEPATAAAGSVVQIAVPVALSQYFLRRSDRIGASLCLAWGATSTYDVARYVADAPTEDLPLIGGKHDWATILGPEHLDALHRADELAYAVRAGSWFLLGCSLLVAVWPVLTHTPPTTVARRV